MSSGGCPSRQAPQKSISSTHVGSLSPTQNSATPNYQTRSWPLKFPISLPSIQFPGRQSANPNGRGIVEDCQGRVVEIVGASIEYILGASSASFPRTADLRKPSAFGNRPSVVVAPRVGSLGNPNATIDSRSISSPLPWCQKTGAVQDLTDGREASWSAVALYRFSQASGQACPKNSLRTPTRLVPTPLRKSEKCANTYPLLPPAPAVP
jgi:hypothetical protein